jgi:hypothetical protein
MDWGPVPRQTNLRRMIKKAGPHLGEPASDLHLLGWKRGRGQDFNLRPLPLCAIRLAFSASRAASGGEADLGERALVVHVYRGVSLVWGPFRCVSCPNPCTHTGR